MTNRTTAARRTPPARHAHRNCIRRASAIIGAGALVIATGILTGWTGAVDRAHAAAPVAVEARYRVAYSGLSIGHLDISARIEGKSYRIDGSFASGGIAKLLKKTNGKATIKGRLEGRGAVPRSFALDYQSGDRKRARRIDFTGGRAARITLDPPRKPRENWVAPTKKDLRDVLDPVSGILARGGSGAEVCDRTLRTFDGTTRVDIAMSHKDTRSFRAKGYRGEAHVCALRPELVAGYKTGKDSVETVRELEGVEAVYAPIGVDGLHQLVELRVPTSFGRMSARVTRLDVSGG